MLTAPSTPEYLPWSEVPISFDRRDHPDIVPKLGRYPLLVTPTIREVKLNRVLVDGGSSLNILFLKTYDQMGFSRSKMEPCAAPFHGVIPGASATPVGQITLPVTFGTSENYRIEYMQFKVADYTYLVLKMSGPAGVITLRGDVKRAYECDRESCDMADITVASLELAKELQTIAESP